MNLTIHVVYPSLQGSANFYCAALCGFFIPSTEELLPAYAQVLYCPLCTIMWSEPVCVCCTADVYRAGVSCGFRAGGHSLSLDQRVDTDTTRPTWDHRTLTRRQSVLPCNIPSHGAERAWIRNLSVIFLCWTLRPHSSARTQFTKLYSPKTLN